MSNFKVLGCVEVALKSYPVGGWVGGWVANTYIVMPLRGSILQVGTCQILSLAENPRWSRVWQKYFSIFPKFNFMKCWVKIILCLKRKKYGLIKIRVQKNLAFKNLDAKKIWGQKIFLVKKRVWFEKWSGSKKLLVKRKFLVQRYCNQHKCCMDKCPHDACQLLQMVS